MKLKFNDLESIRYKDAKKLEKFDYFEEHDCDCDFCHNESIICPYCKEECNSDSTKDDLIGKCSECGKKAFYNYLSWRMNEKIIKDFENK
jgi:hypothetical protein